MGRFLSVLEKAPRRGTALDRVYGYHVEHGSLDSLVKRYEDRTKQAAGNGEGWMLLGLIEAPRGPARLRKAPGQARPRLLAAQGGPSQDRGGLPPRRRPRRPGEVLRRMDRSDARRRRRDGPTRPDLRPARSGGRLPGLAR